MAGVVNESVDAMDTEVQIKPEDEDGGWSKLVLCATQPTIVSSSGSRPQINVKDKTVDGPANSVYKKLVIPVRMKIRRDTKRVYTPIEPVHTGNADVCSVTPVIIKPDVHEDVDKVKDEVDSGERKSSHHQKGTYKYK